MAKHYLNLKEIAELLGIDQHTASSMKNLPEPDATVGRTRGWSRRTIEEWNAQRPGHAGRPAGSPNKPKNEE